MTFSHIPAPAISGAGGRVRTAKGSPFLIVTQKVRSRLPLSKYAPGIFCSAECSLSRTFLGHSLFFTRWGVDVVNQLLLLFQESGRLRELEYVCNALYLHRNIPEYSDEHLLYQQQVCPTPQQQ